MARLENKTALITGASRGIGAAIARAFAAEGARVVLVSRRQESVDAVAAEINAAHPGRAFAKACHVGHEDQIGELLDWVQAEVGLVDVLINNAGTNPFFGPMLLVQRPAWDKTFDVNLYGAFLLSRAVGQRLIDAGKPGSIVSVSSVLGMGAAPFQGVYGMTKAALISMTQTLAIELGGAGIRVNAISPGLVDTKLAAALTSDDELAKVFTERSALKRYAQPEELAGPAVFLASDEASYVSGHVLVVDGGYMAG